MTTWFEADARANFERFLPLLPADGPRTLVQIGVWAGDASAWLLEHLMGPEDTLYDVDPFMGTPGEHGAAEAEQAYDRYVAMLESSPLVHRVRVCRRTSDQFFASVKRSLALTRGWVDFAYIDGDHSYHQVSADIENAWPLIKPGGIMACDDYQWWSPGREYNRPRPALLAFLEAHQGEYEVLEAGYQLWLRKG